MESANITYEAFGDTLVIHMPKELDHHNCRRLKTDTDLMLEENFVRRILFDFGKTEFMDSSGIGVLLSRYKEMAASRGSVCYYGAGARVMRILKMSGICGLLKGYASREEALETGAFKKREHFAKTEMEDRENGGCKEHIRLEMESRSDNEEFARVVAAVFMSRLDPTIEETDDVKTAVSEAVTNAVIHGYKEGEGTVWMELTADRKDRCLTVRITDQGVGIQDIEKAMEPMYTTDRSGDRSGMGFSFMEAFMDQVEVKSEPGRGTAVTMKKYIGR